MQEDNQIYVYEKILKNGFKNMSHMLIVVKSIENKILKSPLRPNQQNLTTKLYGGPLSPQIFVKRNSPMGIGLNTLLIVRIFLTSKIGNISIISS